MNKLLHIVVVLALAASAAAKTSSSSSSRSSSSSSSSRSSSSGWGSSSKPSSSSGWGSSSKPSAVTPTKPASSSGWGGAPKPSATAPSTTTTPKTSSSTALNKLNQSAAVTPMKSKDDFIKDFKKQNEAKYQNKFSTEPTSRPSHIPQTTTTTTGAQVPLTFNPGIGGYGYYSGANWVTFDPLLYAATHAYTPYSATYHTGYTAGPSIGFGGLFILAIAIIIAGIAIRHFRS